MRKILLLIVTLITLPVMAQIYSYKDSDGNTIYTNDPPPGVKADSVRLGQSQKMTSPVPNKTSKPGNQQTEATPISASRIYLDGVPDNEEAFRANNGTFNVTIKIEPDGPLPGHQYRLVLDGTSGQPQDSPTFTVESLPRGSHTLVGIILKNGIPVAQTEAKSFTVQRAYQIAPMAR